MDKLLDSIVWEVFCRNRFFFLHCCTTVGSIQIGDLDPDRLQNVPDPELHRHQNTDLDLCRHQHVDPDPHRYQNVDRDPDRHQHVDPDPARQNKEIRIQIGIKM
jgi:hypothetical protein